MKKSSKIALIIVSVSVSLTLLYILLISLITFFAASETKHWEFDKDCSEVTEIKIVDLDTAENYYDHENYVVIKELDIGLIEDLCYDIENFEMHGYGPNLASPYGKCFFIGYSNGEFDLISAKEPKRFRYSDEYGEILAYNSWMSSDESEFEALINKYLNMEEST